MMKKYSIYYDKFCLGKYVLTCDAEGNVVVDEELGAFEMYVLGMWNDGLVVTMKICDEEKEENYFILLLPDGSEQLMVYSSDKGFAVDCYKKPGQGRFAYLLNFLRGTEYRGFRGYEEYDEEEKVIIGVVVVNEKTCTYGGQNMPEVYRDFQKVIDEALNEES